MRGSVHFLISDLAPGALLVTAPLRAPFRAATTQVVESEVLYLPIFGSSPRCRVGFGLFCSVTQIKLFRKCAELWESQVCFTGMNSLVFRDIIRVSA